VGNQRCQQERKVVVMTSAVEFVAERAEGQGESKSLEQILGYARGVVDPGDVQDAVAQAEAEARRADAAEDRMLAYRAAGINLAARSKRMERRMNYEDKLAEAKETVERCERALAEIQQIDTFEAERLRIAEESMSRSANIAGLADFPAAVRESHGRLVERARFTMEHGYQATQNAVAELEVAQQARETADTLARASLRRPEPGSITWGA
jgi:hypothetical protein